MATSMIISTYVLLLIVLAFFSLLVLLFFMCRWLYKKSIRLKNRLKMDRALTITSHELLTPLTVLTASVENLRRQEPAYAKEYAMMDLNIERMTRLIQEIVETGKSQSGNLALKVSQGDVMEYIRRTALTIMPLFQRQGLVFDIHCNPRSMMGWIDTDKVDKIIYNLLSNAAKYTGTPGHVELIVNTNDHFDKIIIEVHDNGIGMSEEKSSRLFSGFHERRSRFFPNDSTGLGLTLSRELTHLHGGSIDCHSEEGKGSVFTVVLPINKESYAPSQIDKSRPFSTTPQGLNVDMSLLEERPLPPKAHDLTTVSANAYRVLLVEDNEELLMIMTALMSSKFRIFKATNGLEALKVIGNHELDIVVSDVMMPQMDGEQLTERIKTTPEWNRLPVILLSSKITEDDRKRALLLGADDFITKPFRLGDLEVRINTIIENRRRIAAEPAAIAAVAEERPLTAEEEFMKRATECVYRHLDDADFDRDAFASDMGTSTSTLYNKLRVLTGSNVSAFIRDIRMKEARRIAEAQPDIRISDLAYKVGYRDPKYFATCFKKAFGVQPSEFIEQINA